MAELLSDRLMALLTEEIDTIEGAAKEKKPKKMLPGRTVAGPARASRPAKTTTSCRSAPAKERIDLLLHLTRVLEKLLELRRLEILAVQGGGEDEAETARLRNELLSRLRNLDAKRRGGPTLFDRDTGAFIGDVSSPTGEVAGSTTVVDGPGEPADAAAGPQ